MKLPKNDETKKKLQRTIERVATPSDLQTYLVGGAVRDALLGKCPKDLDFLVTGVSEQEMADLGFERVGESVNAPVYIHPETGDEFALARREQNADSDTEHDREGYHGFKYDTEDVTIEEDLERRDLTINAIAYDPVRDKIVDPHGGVEDLHSKTLRHVSEAFAEDPLRVLRTARFAARLPDFDIARSTIDMMKETAPKMERLPVERFTQELKKLFKEARSPRRFFDILASVEAIKYFWPELSAMKQRPAGPDEYHGDNTVFDHSMQALEHAHEQKPNNSRVLLGALTHDLGKVKTPENNLPHHYEHEKIGAEMADETADKLRFSTEWRRVMRHASRDHLKVPQLPQLKATTALKIGKRLVRDRGLDPGEFLAITRADKAAQPGKDSGVPKAVKHELSVIQTILKEIGGEQIKQEHPNIDPGADGEHFGEVLRMERVQVLQAYRSLREAERPDSKQEALTVAERLVNDHDLNHIQFSILGEIVDVSEAVQRAFEVCHDIDGSYIQERYPEIQGEKFGEKLKSERLSALDKQG